MLMRAMLKTVLLPPGVFLLGLWLAFILLVFARNSTVLRRWGLGVLLVCNLGLYLFSTPFMASILSQSIEQHPPLDLTTLKKGKPAAIVILGAGDYNNAKEFAPYSEFGSMTVDGFTLERMRYGAFLHRQTDLPMLVSGAGDEQSVASLMAESLQRDFQVRATWLEGNSRTTWENARNSKRILNAEAISKVIVVTHGFHMRRAVYAFEQQGFEVVPAPTVYSNRRAGSGVKHWLPNVAAMHEVRRALHEHAGLWVYRYLSPEVME